MHFAFDWLLKSAGMALRPFGRERKSKRVLMVVELLARGGAERQLIALTHGLLREGYQVQIFELTGVVAGQADFAQEIASLGVRVCCASTVPSHRFGTNWFSASDLGRFPAILTPATVRHCCALARTICDYSPGVVNGWSDYANVIGGSVAARMGVPRIVLGLRTRPPIWLSPTQSANYCSAYKELVGRPGVRIINNSQLSKQAYDRWLELAPGTINVVYNGLLPSLVHPRKREEIAAYRAWLGIPDDAVVVGGLMRFAAVKDPHLWLETAAVIFNARPSAYFLLAGYGHGNIGDRLAHLGAKLGLADRLVMPGVVTDISRIYAAMNVLLLTSEFENTPNILIEAQAAGIPVVGPDVGGVAETMKHQATGLLVLERSAPKLADAVLQILNEPDGLLTKARVEGPAFVAQRFGYERMVRETTEIYS